MNISKKTRKKIKSILLSDHFGESGEYISTRSFSYTPAPNSPLSAIWKKIVVKLDGEKLFKLSRVRSSSSIRDAILQDRVSRRLIGFRKWVK